MKEAVLFVLTSVVLLGCGTVEKTYVAEGTLAEDRSSIFEVRSSGTTSGRARSQIQQLDDEFIGRDYSSTKAAIQDDLRVRYKIIVSPGNHKIRISCWRGLGSAKWFTVSFNALKGHDYAAKCEVDRDCGMFTCEANWWVEIVDLGTNEVVLKSEVVWHTVG